MLEELMLAVECNNPTIACLQKIGVNIQVGELILGQARASGDGVQFASVAYRIYQRARERGLGTEVDTDLWLQGAEYIP